ncbi:hypothetical protein R4P64_29990 [Rhodococcus sp. IEGM 1366]|uniref:hypothetical protein n=1 Tax=Rhodococcus sp. IEGM 1366 TaxID=3082223 RepID=UPI002955C5B8|nr:hypothetical protein [Rhodococcus sp. IEGM 1366]MDV8070762.1 hypothetical protein [Rhodococcus sp. IEGM 1366]
MRATTENLRPFETIIGRWRTSGTVLDERGNPEAAIDGSGTYGTMTEHHSADESWTFSGDTMSSTLRSSMTASWERRNTSGNWIP